MKKPLIVLTEKEVEELRQFNPSAWHSIFATLCETSHAYKLDAEREFTVDDVIEVYNMYFPAMEGKLSDSIFKKLYNEFKNNDRSGFIDSRGNDPIMKQFMTFHENPIKRKLAGKLHDKKYESDIAASEASIKSLGIQQEPGVRPPGEYN